MKRFLLRAALFGLVLGATTLGLLRLPSSAQETPAWKEAVTRMSRIQALLEYVYMETGEYPPSLEFLERSFNHGLPDKAPKVAVPVDPATSKPFVYELSQDGRRYRLAPPDPGAYGANAVTLQSLEWGWMAALARQRRAEQLALECRYHIEILATQCEMFAKDNSGRFPTDLAELIPKYLPRHLVCPVTGKAHQFTRTTNGYYISCPNPANHGLKKFGYASDKGLVVEPLDNRPPSPSASPSPAIAPTPSPSPSAPPAPSR